MEPAGSPSDVLMALNRQLMRVVLRAPGSLPFLDEENQLVEDIVATGWLPRDSALAVCALLLPRWRRGRMTHFTRRYLLWALWQQQASSSNSGPRPDPTALAGGEQPEVWALVRDLVTAFRHSLNDPTDLLLLDAWIDNEGRQGWQHEFVLAQAKSDTWVSRRLREFRERFRERYGVADPDTLVRLARSDPQFEKTTESPVGQTWNPAPPDEPSAPESLEWLRQQLHATFPAGSREQQFMDEMYSGASAEEVRSRYPDEEELLLQLHAWYCSLAGEAK